MGASEVFAAVLVVSAAAGCWAFVTLYTWWYPWWRSEPGTHLCVFVGCLGLLDTLFAAGVFWPGTAWLQTATLVAFVPEPLIVWWRVSLLLRTKRANRDTAAGKGQAGVRVASGGVRPGRRRR